uniref:vascular cell adhesion protein 1 n=1 Tax=Semicossyphus pulcher TaxID=241346 RepID=UPI0037E7C7FC
MLPLRTLGPLMVMILLCDADSTCPAELTLDPPVVVKELGASVEVNCSSTEEDHDGMYWRINNTDSEMEDEKSFVTEFLKLSDWDITAQCRIKMNATFECRRDLEITMYKNPDHVSMFPIKHFNGVEEGTLYELQCDILEVAPVQNLTVTWYKGNEAIKKETFTNTTKRPMEMSSTLILNISREDDGAEFRCEAQLDFGPYGVQPPVTDKTHRVSVLYAPKFKSNTQSDYYILLEGNDVTLSCEAEGKPPPVFHWTRDGVNMLEKTSHLNLSQVDNSAIYNCTASNHLGSITKRIKVDVIRLTGMAAPVAPTVSEASPPSSTEALLATTPKASTSTYLVASTPGGCPLVLTPAEIVVRFGDPASVNCSTTAPDAELIGWEAIIGGTGVQQPPATTWAVDKLEEWTVNPKCFVTKGNGEQCIEMLFVTLYKIPDMVSVSAKDPGLMLEDKDFLLTCDIINVAPVQNLTLKWYKGDEMLHTETFSDTNVTPVNKSSPLRVTPRRDDNGASFKCKAELHLGPNGPYPFPTMTSPPYIAEVQYAPVFKEEGYSKDLMLGENVTFHCSAEGNPPPKINWSYPPAANVNVTTGGQNISITGATSTNVGHYICNATNRIATVKKSVIVSVIMPSQEDPAPWLWTLLLCMLVPLLTIIIIIAMYRLLSHRKKNGQYSFVSNKAVDDMPMTPKPEA